jgi:hypothetical protein
VLVVGGILAVASGLGYNATAAIQQHEAVRASAPARRLLPALARRALWLLALLGDLAAPGGAGGRTGWRWRHWRWRHWRWRSR